MGVLHLVFIVALIFAAAPFILGALVYGIFLAPIVAQLILWSPYLVARYVWRALTQH